MTVTLRNGAVTARIWTGRARRRIRRLSSRGGSGFSVLLLICGKGRGVYGLIGRKHITSVLPVREKAAEPPAQTVGRSFFCGAPSRSRSPSGRGFCGGVLDFRDDAYRRVVIDSFERDVLHLQLGGTLPLADIARIEEPDD